ncbi:hypothetical protein CDD82_3075 [Ophiocordyceps australis]|uniref:Uncharacterized protein n=1 Tax=Ophiocordyceps australis TaxID=1399860 RepID=A0A2C5ZF86_9HYPO|nr:hypothetical protein CDD82_3075 [Ophiocordyceps australis]
MADAMTKSCVTCTWATGEGERRPGELNPRGWRRVDFGDVACSCFMSSPDGDASCQHEQCQDTGLVLEEIEHRYQARVALRESSLSPLTSCGPTLGPVCCSTPIAGLPSRISHLSIVFDTVTSQISDPRTRAWWDAISARLHVGEEDGVGMEWKGRLIWSAAGHEDFLDYIASWAPARKQLAQCIPASSYPSRLHAGHNAPFVDIGLGSSLGFLWALNLDWDTQFSAAVTVSIAYWADMASGPDAPEGHLADVFDVLPSLSRACTTGRTDNLSPMKALVIEYLACSTIPALCGPLPGVQDIWLSRMADVGARESCVGMTSCPAPFSPYRSADDTRLYVAWGVIHDMFDLPRDLASGNRINAVLWAFFSGFSASQVLLWLRESVALACRLEGRGSCAAKLLLCSAFVHVTNPRWAVNGLALANFSKWPSAPGRRRLSKSCLSGKNRKNRPMLPDFSDLNSHAVGKQDQVCNCKSSHVSQSLSKAAADALRGTVAGFATASQRLDAHNTGLSALLAADWDTLIALSRNAWGSFWEDTAAIAAWVDATHI